MARGVDSTEENIDRGGATAGLGAAVLGSEHVSQDVNTDERISAMGATFSELNILNAKRTYDLHQSLDLDAMINARRLQTAEDNMRLRHSEELHKQALRHAETEHVIKVQTLSVSSVGNSRIIADIAQDTADQIVSHVRSTYKGG